MNESRSHFEFSILKSILSILTAITEVRSPGGLQWIFSLLLKVTSKNAHYVAAKCVSLLNKMSEELESRTNPYHLLLRSRYGLYGTPLELELFDIEPPPYVKSSSTYVTYASAVAGDNTSQNTDFFENYSFNKESINPKDVLSGTETKLKWRNLAPPKIYRGLIETEPLHFTCVSASEGTRLERADASNNIVINEIPFSVTPFHGQGWWREVPTTNNALSICRRPGDVEQRFQQDDVEHGSDQFGGGHVERRRQLSSLHRGIAGGRGESPPEEAG
jgi:hypothetical protein